MFKKLKIIVRTQLTQGVSPYELALTCSFAVVIGTFPLFGTTTLLCLVAGILFRLNQPLLQAMNYAMTPIYLILVPVFLKIGEFILNQPAIPIHPEEMLARFRLDWHGFFSDYGLAIVHAIFAWALIAPLVGVLTFLSIKPLVIKINRHRNL